MGAQKRGAPRVSEDPEELARVPLQAILLADSFTTKFRPITLERPKVLLPLVNVPMINYTLAWLESAGVEEVFVFCCAHSKQVIDYLESSEWFAQPNFTVTTIESHNSVSAGDALRLIYERNVIHGDFVLISGDTLSNMSLTQVLKEHKERRKKDSNAVMTIVIKRSKPSQITHQSRLGNDELFMATDPNTKQLLYYEDKEDHTKGSIYLDKLLIADNPSITLHNDKQIMGYKIFTHEIHSSYAARIDNFRSYDTVSKDIIQRWTYPLVPDVKFFGNSSIKLERQGMYRASDTGQSRSAQIGPFTVIGSGTKIGNNTKISNSVIGEGCSIGSNVSIEGSYIWDNATIEDGCKLRHAIVCDGVIMRSGAVLEPGVVLSFKVVIGQKFNVLSYSKVSLLQQPTKLDSDDELEYADNSSGIAEMSSITPVDKLNEETTNQRMEANCWPTSELGTGGAGYVWSICEGGHDEEWRHSVAPIPADKLLEAIHAADDDLEHVQDGSSLPPSGELKPDSNDSEGDDVVSIEDSADFEREVEATFLRAVHENIQVDHVILEVNSLRLSYNKVAADCAGALFYSMMKLALETPYGSPVHRNNSLRCQRKGELVQATVNIFTKWKKVLKSYLAEIDEEIEVILRFEEMCESLKEFSPVFDKILHQLYELEIIQEEAIMRWDAEKKNAEEADRVYVKQSADFIQWLREAEEEDEDEEDEEDEE
ncbi:uncharacterized protein LOC126593281 isoform X4 [Malus sylvestris]|uniref:uncharacterized protein LOC126593281 isoform X4 n=1 Tax=Malus sylvestris TaxID=3752 RepID=UPI0021AD40CB|nr:uncharacterized protein LOC126593281 isoform X4 [Malus sylvestris]